MGEGAALARVIGEANEQLQAALDTAGPKAGSITCDGELTIKGLLAVRAWWSDAVVDWIEAGLRGETPPTPAPDYKWNQTPALNAVTAARSARRSYRSVRDDLLAAVVRVQQCIATLDNEQLFEAHVFEWAGKWPIARWLMINTARQYSTARTLVRRATKR